MPFDYRSGRPEQRRGVWSPAATAPDATRPDEAGWWSLPAFRVSGRVAAACLLGAGALGLATSALDHDSALGSLLKLVGGSVSVGFVPGALVLLGWRPRQRFSLFEIGALALGSSFGLVQLLTVAALLLHRGIAEMLAVLVAIAVIHAAMAIARGSASSISVSRGEVLLGTALLGLATLAYFRGSPYGASEDIIHVAITRRLVSLDSPAIDNIYYVPGVIYTYPFPGTHYLMALMAQAGGVEPLFLYHKLRCFWLVAAALALYGFTAAVFESRRIALAVGSVAAAFVANGTFADVRGFFWGQLAPLSHASDVAMAVLLPSLLLLAVNFLTAERRREQLFFLPATMALGFMLIVVHTREVVQFVVYLSAFAAVLLITGRSVGMQRRLWVMLGATVVMLVAYAGWHGQVVPVVSQLVSLRRQEIIEIMRRASVAEWLAPPTRLLNDYTPEFGAIFYGWNPLLLLAGVPALYHFRGRPLVVLLGSSILAYLLIMRVPLLAAAYVYATYFEILFTAVRNVIFFIYIFAGVVVYLVAARLARLGAFAGVPLAVCASGVAALVFHFGESELARRRDVFFLPGLVAYTWLVYRWWRSRRQPADDRTVFPAPRLTAAIAGVMVVSIAVLTRLPDTALLAGPFQGGASTPEVLRANLPCIERNAVEAPFLPAEIASEKLEIPAGRSCPPPADVLRFSQERLSADAVLAIDKFESFPVPLLMPQQVVTWPSASVAFLDEEQLFRNYFRYYRLSMLEHRVQPFFNDRESREQRIDFVRGLGVTHVLVDPSGHGMMSRVLGQYPDLFRPVYDRNGWAIYEVAR